MSGFRSPQVVLFSEDLPRAVAFYSSLGFTETFRVPAEDEPIHVDLDLDGGDSGGVPETVPECAVAGGSHFPDYEGRDAIVEGIIDATMLGRAASFDVVANVAVFAASDLARSMTATSLNITCGAIAD